MSLHPSAPGLSTIPAFCLSPPAAGSDEPIATPTIAGIYLRQGLPHRALKVYRDLLQNEPENHGLRRQMEELEARLRAEEEQMRQGSESPAAAQAPDPPLTATLPGQREIALLTAWLEAARRRRRHVS